MKLQTLVQLKNLLEGTAFFAVPMRWADVRDWLVALALAVWLVVLVTATAICTLGATGGPL